MLHLSHILISNQELTSFEELLTAVAQYAKGGERFFRIDVKPPFPDTPENWEEQLEATFSGLLR